MYDNFELIKSYRITLDSENTSIYNSHKKDFLYPFFKAIVPKIQAIPHEVFEDFNQSYDVIFILFSVSVQMLN